MKLLIYPYLLPSSLIFSFLSDHQNPSAIHQIWVPSEETRSIPPRFRPLSSSSVEIHPSYLGLCVLGEPVYVLQGTCISSRFLHSTEKRGGEHCICESGCLKLIQFSESLDFDCFHLKFEEAVLWVYQKTDPHTIYTQKLQGRREARK